jgi:hypothetical protein
MSGTYLGGNCWLLLALRDPVSKTSRSSLAVVCSLEQYMATLVEIILMQTIGAAFVEQEHSMSQFDLAGLTAALKPFPDF